MNARQKSLFLRLVVMILLAVVPATASLAWRTFSQWRDGQERLQAELSVAAQQFARSVERDLESSADALKVLSQSEIFQQGRVAAMGRMLGGRPRVDWDSVFLLDREGAVVLDTASPRSADAQRELQALHAQALPSRNVVMGTVQGTRPASAIALPLIQGANVRYVLGARLNASHWQRLASGIMRPPGSRVVLVDSGGREIANPALTVADPDVYRASEPVAGAGWLAHVSLPAGPIDAARRRSLLVPLAQEGGAILAGLLLAGLWAWRFAARSPTALCGGSRDL